MVGGLGGGMKWKMRLIGTAVCVPYYTISLVNLGMQLIYHVINIY